jgi:hypothetical protein
MGFKKSSSRVEGELLSIGIIRKTRGKGFPMVSFQSVVRAQKRIQNPPRKRCQNVIMQSTGWENHNPIHKMAITMGYFTHYPLK